MFHGNPVNESVEPSVLRTRILRHSRKRTMLQSAGTNADFAWTKKLLSCNLTLYFHDNKKLIDKVDRWTLVLITNEIWV